MLNSKKTGQSFMIGIDIGGANLKVVDREGAHIHYCPLWKRAPITDILRIYSDEEHAAVVMSGEQADCFVSTKEGVDFIVSAVKEVFPNAIFYGTDGLFHPLACPELAAANWLVMADVLRAYFPDALLIDMGSTTTDLIPLNAFDAMKGLTDYSRLGSDLLLYYGVLRTPISSLLKYVCLDGVNVRLSTEYFACSGDAHIISSFIRPEEYTTATPDNTGRSVEECLRRMARMVCADLSDLGREKTEIIAKTYINREKTLISDAVGNVMEKFGCSTIITSGIGSGLLKSWFRGEDLKVCMGEYSDAMPAWAVREAALRKG